MLDHAHLIDDLRAPTKELCRAIPDVWGAFAKLHLAAPADGALPALTKELMALAISIVKECDGSIASPARPAARLDATPDQVAALAWRQGATGPEYLLVTSRRSGRWIFPKGGVVAGRTPGRAAGPVRRPRRCVRRPGAHENGTRS